MNHKWKYQPPTPETKEAAKALATEVHYNRPRCQSFFPSSTE